MRYGFIGLGHLGRFLAGSLVRADFDLTVNDLDKANAGGLIASGAKWAADPQAVAEQVDCVITCLPSPKVSEAVLTGMAVTLMAAYRPSWLVTFDDQRYLKVRR